MTMKNIASHTRSWRAKAFGVAALALAAAAPAFAWEPTKPVEFVIPTGTGGGADQMGGCCRASSSSTSS